MDDLHDLRITFRVKLKRWRIDDQQDLNNREWALKVFDRNKEQWVNINDLTRPGEYGSIESIREVEE
jgi:hypothetical protein